MASSEFMVALVAQALPSAAAAGDTRDAVRLRLRHPSVADGFVDGGWWPRSTDLRVELRPLLAVLHSAGYTVHRVTYEITPWNPTTDKIRVSGRSTQLIGSRIQAPATISLINYADSSCLDLVVVPPTTKAATAERCLALAGFSSDLHASQILDGAHRQPPLAS